MAFTLKIKAKEWNGIPFSFGDLLNNCGLNYGHDNDFYVLDEGMNDSTAILYNPNRIGRGIFFDGRGIDEDEIVLSYNIPTTEAEIKDFIKVAAEVARQLGEVTMYCEEEEQEFTIAGLEENLERMVEFSRLKLMEFCQNQDYPTKIFTLAKWPLYLMDEWVERFAQSGDMKQFEQLLHDVQDKDVYYAKPRLYRNTEGAIGAFYTLTEECESIFPLKADGFLNMDNLQIQDGIVQYYIFSEDRVVDGLFDYDKFIAKVQQMGAVPYDATHVLVPSLTKDKIEELVKVTNF